MLVNLRYKIELAVLFNIQQNSNLLSIGSLQRRTFLGSARDWQLEMKPNRNVVSIFFGELIGLKGWDRNSAPMQIPVRQKKDKSRLKSEPSRRFRKFGFGWKTIKPNKRERPSSNRVSNNNRCCTTTMSLWHTVVSITLAPGLILCQFGVRQYHKASAFHASKKEIQLLAKQKP